jgi:hypothetical protein
LFRLLMNGRSPALPSPPGWAPREVKPTGAAPSLLFESVNVPKVMGPWELKEHISFLLGEAAPRQPAAAEVARVAGPFLHRWRALWAAYGEAEEGWPAYRALLNQFVRDLKAAGASELVLVNEVDFHETFCGMVLGVALSDRKRDTSVGEERTAPAPAGPNLKAGR